MSEDTEQLERRRNPLKTIGTIMGIAAVTVSLVAGFSKSYYVTPLKLEEHDRQIMKLQQVDSETAKELRDQHDLLLEIRSDVKVLNRMTRNNSNKEN